MKDKILALLKTKYVGVSEALLIRVAEKLASTVTKEEDVDAAVEAFTFQQIIDMEADRRVTDASKTAVSNYEKKHGLKDGQKVETEGAPKVELPKTDDKETPTFDKKVLDLLNALTQKVQNLEGQSITKTRKQQLETQLKEVPDSFRLMTIKNFDKLQFATDEEFETYLNDIKADTETVLKEFAAKGAVITPPAGGSTTQSKEPSKEQVEEISNKINI